MSENKDELIKAQNEVIGILFEVIKKLQAKIYEKDIDREKIIPFINSAINVIADNDLKKILVEITQ